MGPFGYIMAINFINRDLLSLAFLYGFSRVVQLKENGEYRRAALLLGIWSVGALLLAAFPTDVPATPVSWHGAVHLVAIHRLVSTPGVKVSGRLTDGHELPLDALKGRESKLRLIG